VRPWAWPARHLLEGRLVSLSDRSGGLHQVDRPATMTRPGRQLGAVEAATLGPSQERGLVNSRPGNLYLPRTFISMAANEGRSGCWSITSRRRGDEVDRCGDLAGGRDGSVVRWPGCCWCRPVGQRWPDRARLPRPRPPAEARTGPTRPKRGPGRRATGAGGATRWAAGCCTARSLCRPGRASRRWSWPAARSPRCPRTPSPSRAPTGSRPASGSTATPATGSATSPPRPPS
jgi:hypothetical protein